MSTGVRKLGKAWKHLSSYRLLVVYFSFTGKYLGLGATWACLGGLIPSPSNGSSLEALHPHSAIVAHYDG